jgi:NhaP-type Na+/H+ or K+/H+ antiporter
LLFASQESFFRNFGSILTFAFLGTFISAVGVGYVRDMSPRRGAELTVCGNSVLVYIWSILGIESLELSLLECLTFGTTLSATDPVTILAIFKQHKVDPKLYTVIFGESLLNDAVSIVMYEYVILSFRLYVSTLMFTISKGRSPNSMGLKSTCLHSFTGQESFFSLSACLWYSASLSALRCP